MNYTEQQLQARNRSLWTKVQGFGALIQFVTFLISLMLVIRYLTTGQGYEITTVFCVAKVLMLYFMTVTGMAWEEEVFGQMFMAKEFFWEDAGNLVSLTGNTAYLITLLNGADKHQQMMVMLFALATYVLNFVQFGLRGVKAAQQRRQARLAMTLSTGK